MYQHARVATATVLGVLTLSSGTSGLAQGSTFDLWYGNTQEFGQLGNPQVWVNVLGNVSDPQGILGLAFSLNGGPDQSLSVGPNTRRLLQAGDFNVEIPYTSLLDGPNTVRIEALDFMGNTTETTMTLDYTAGQVWPQDSTVDWSASSDIQDLAQVVDGQWALEADGIRPTVLGYDRAFAVGDLAWTNFEVTVPVTVHGIDPAGFMFPSVAPGVGFTMRWTGHTDLVPGEQPHQYWKPAGATAWYGYDTGRAILIGWDGYQKSDPLFRQLVFGTRYIWKTRAETRADGSNFYGFKFWEDGEPEPADWEMSIVEGLDDQTFGSLLFVAHHVDVTFGDVQVASLGADSVPPEISNVAVTPSDASATVTWTTNEPATSVVDYGLTSAYELGTVTLPGLATGHSVGLSPLLPSTSYHCRVTSLDGAGNAASSADVSFTTQPTGMESSLSSDDFSSAVLDPDLWTFLDPLDDSRLRMTGTEVEIELDASSAHDAWTDGITTPRIRQSCLDEDFAIDVRFDSPVAQTIQQQGILIEQDPTHFIRVEFLFQNQTKAFVASILGGSATIHRFSSLAVASTAFLRVVRSGDDWTVLHSPDGVAYSEVVSFSQAIVVSGVSLYAGNSTGTPHTLVADYFFDSASPISPEDENPSALVVNTVGHGSVQRTPELLHYLQDDIVDLMAIPDPGHQFLGWSGDAVGVRNPLLLSLLDPLSVTATFGLHTGEDCNGNGVDDVDDLAAGTSADCNGSGVPDECEIADGTSQDCDADGVPDECELDCDGNGTPDVCDLSSGTHPDCDGNGVPDVCDLASGASADCNGNGVPDACDITGGASRDGNGNGVPDDCEADCNGNGVDDGLDITSGTSADCNGNGLPDECDIADGTSEDCGGDGIPDECQADCDGNGVHDVCDIASGTWPDCDGNGVPDTCDLSSGASADCNGNGVPDACDIAGGTSSDGNGNGVPDDCEVDCNGNGVDDSLDIGAGTSVDCNGNGVPDECDIADGTSEDCGGDGIPDECQADCDGNGVHDACDIASGTWPDCNGNGVPDTCDLSSGTSQDCDGDGVPDGCEADCDGDGLPDACEADCDGNGVPDGCQVSSDCNRNGIPDDCEPDCDGDGIPDACELDGGGSGDCNGNGVPDECDIALGTSADADGDGIPDECGGLAGHWMFDSGTGDMALDASGGGHDGTLAGASWSPETGDGSPFSLDFDGVNDAVNIAPIDISGTGLTIAAWVKPDDFGVTDARILSKAVGTRAAEHFWMLSTFRRSGEQRLRMRLRAAGSTSTLIASEGALVAGSWAHVAAVYDGSTMALYLDGVLVGSQAKSGDLDVDPSVGVAIGNQPPGAGNVPFDGRIDDVRLYGRALSPGELQQLAGSFVDCNGNGSPDALDLSSGTSADCNGNGVPDECDVASGTSVDGDGNGVPDECELDCNGNGVVDSEDIAAGTSVDADGDGVPDECGGLVAHWRFDEGVGSIAADSGAGGHDGDVSGATWSPESGDGSPFSLDFDGVDDAVNVGALDVPGTELTLTAWIRPDDFGTSDARIVSKAFGTQAAAHLWMLSTIRSGGQYRLRMRLGTDGSTSTLVADSGALSAGTWAHVAAVYDGATMALYLDGVLVGSQPKAGMLDVDPNVSVSIGNQPPGAGNRAFDGRIDDVRVYSRALSSGELQQLAGR